MDDRILSPKKEAVTFEPESFARIIKTEINSETANAVRRPKPIFPRIQKWNKYEGLVNGDTSSTEGKRKACNDLSKNRRFHLVMGGCKKGVEEFRKYKKCDVDQKYTTSGVSSLLNIRHSERACGIFGFGEFHCDEVTVPYYPHH